MRQPQRGSREGRARLGHAAGEGQPQDEEDGGREASRSRPGGGQVEEVGAAAHQAPYPRQCPKGAYLPIGHKQCRAELDLQTGMTALDLQTLKPLPSSTYD